MPSSGSAIRQLVLTVYAPTVVLAFCQGMLAPLLPLYARSFDVGYGLIGLFLAAAGLGMLVCDVPVGMLLSRIGPRPAMIVGLGGFAACLALLFLAPGLALATVFRFCMGGFHAMWNLSRHAYLAEVTVTAQRGRAIAAFGGSARIGLFAGPAVGGALAGALGLRVPFLAAALLAVPALVCILLFVKPTTMPRIPRKGHLRGVLRGSFRSLATAGSAQMLAQMIRAGRNLIVPLWGTDIAGLGVPSVGLIMSIASFVDMSMFVPAGLLMDKLGRKFAIVPCFTIQAVGMCLIPATGGFAGLLVVACVIGMGNGLGSGTMMTMGADLAPPERVGEFLGLWRLIGDAGSAGSPLAAGALAGILGLVASAFFMAIVGFASAAVFAFTVPEPLDKGARHAAD